MKGSLFANETAAVFDLDAADRGGIDAVPLDQALIQSSGDCYMHCSYVEATDKHEIKRVINRKLCEVVAPLNVEECTRSVVRKNRPTIVVPLEWFGSYHAMYRCYAPSMMQLKERFRLVAILRRSTEQPSIDEKAKEVFDKVVELAEDQASISAFLEAIKREEPDIIYYPSIGMAAWFVALSNFRLAPIQVMTPGHPATTMSDKIDCMLSEGDLFGDEKNYVEKCIHLPVGSVRYVERAPMTMPQHQTSDEGPVRIAVPAMEDHGRVEAPSGVPLLPEYDRPLLYAHHQGLAPLDTERHHLPAVPVRALP